MTRRWRSAHAASSAWTSFRTTLIMQWVCLILNKGFQAVFPDITLPSRLGLSSYVGGSRSLLLNAEQPVLWEGKNTVIYSSLCIFSWCIYSYHSWFQVTDAVPLIPSWEMMPRSKLFSSVFMMQTQWMSGNLRSVSDRKMEKHLCEGIQFE